MVGEAIFIGYRRDDTADVAGRIFDAMTQRFGKGRVFKDVDNIGPGVHFGDYIRSVLPKCRVALMLVGPHWLESKDEDGRRRLDDEHDWVRTEIETALSTPGVLTVPVLVNGARMPRASEVPESLRPLLLRNAAVIRRDPDFHDDVERLATALRASVNTGVLDLSKINIQVRAIVVEARASENRANTSAQRGRQRAGEAEELAVLARQGHSNTILTDPVGPYQLTFAGSADRTLGVWSANAGIYDGNFYSGDFREHTYWGVGVDHWRRNAGNTDGSLSYEGSFVRGQRDGVGIYRWTSGQTYAGDFHENRIEGRGVLRSADGHRYEGNFVNGLKDGYGVEWDSEGRIVYQGLWSGGSLTTPLSR